MQEHNGFSLFMGLSNYVLLNIYGNLFLNVPLRLIIDSFVTENSVPIV